jgi:hypothetical protein
MPVSCAGPKASHQFSRILASRTRPKVWQATPHKKVSELLSVRNINPSYCVATWDRVLIQLWRGEATLEAAQQWLKIGEAFLLERAGESCSSLSIVESTSPPPADKVRLALSASFRGLAPHVRHQIVVAEGSVFRSALVRGVGLTLSLVPLRYAVSIDEAALTLAPDLSPAAGGADGLKTAVSTIRYRIDAYSRVAADLAP